MYPDNDYDDGFTPDGMSALNPDYEEQCQRWQAEFALDCAAVHDEIFGATSELPLANFSDSELRTYLAWLDETGRKSSARVIREELESLHRTI